MPLHKRLMLLWCSSNVYWIVKKYFPEIIIQGHTEFLPYIPNLGKLDTVITAEKNLLITTPSADIFHQVPPSPPACRMRGEGAWLITFPRFDPQYICWINRNLLPRILRYKLLESSTKHFILYFPRIGWCESDL